MRTFDIFIKTATRFFQMGFLFFSTNQRARMVAMTPLVFLETGAMFQSRNPPLGRGEMDFSRES
jgi:hypothetical protein